jgi:LysM repeat protein
MDFINNYKLIEKDGEYTLIIYLDKMHEEFADEFGNADEKKKTQLIDSIQDYINKNFPKLKINLCKIMLGTMLVATVPLVNNINVKAADTSTYKVVSGDTLWKLSQRFGTSINSIKSLNNLTSDTIYVNQDLLVPSTNNATTHKVVSGDTLYKIAKTYGTSIDNLKNINNLSSDMIYVGQTLKVQKSTKESVEEVPTKYKVSIGDTLWGISNRYNISVSTIKELNNLNSDLIYPGQILLLKGTTTSTKPSVSYVSHKVESGENIWTISIKYGIPQSELMEVNGFNENTQLSIGQYIKIPVHNIPVKKTVSAKNGEYLDWWSEAQYVFPINKVAKVTDYHTGKSFNIKRTIGANHADCEPLTATDTAIAKSIWGGYSWKVRPIIVEVDGRKLAASMSFMPHSIQNITNNNFDGHFDIHFANSTRHKDGLVDMDHQREIKISAGITKI